MRFPDLDDALLRPYAYSPREHARAAVRREEARVAAEAAEEARAEEEKRERAQAALDGFRKGGG